MRFVRTRVAARLLAVAGAAVLASCANAPVNTADDIDYVKIAQIERAAKAFGTQVIWVNYPTKRSEPTK